MVSVHVDVTVRIVGTRQHADGHSDQQLRRPLADGHGRCPGQAPPSAPVELPRSPAAAPAGAESDVVIDLTTDEDGVDAADLSDVDADDELDPESEEDEVRCPPCSRVLHAP